jgi:parvulin-like peptidyl-prolyl isomerase
MVMFFLFLAIGCTQSAKTTEKEEPVIEKPSTEGVVTDPNGVVLTINGMDVTKAELDEAVKQMTPPASFGVTNAFRMHFLAMDVIKKEYGKDLDKLVVELNGIVKKIKSGEITFEAAVEQYSNDPQKVENQGLMKDYVPGTTFYIFDKVIRGMKVGDVSDAFATPLGAAAVKLEKVTNDSNGDLVSVDVRQIMLTLDKFLPEGTTLVSKLSELAQSADIKILDNSLLREIPDIALIGVPAEKQEARRKEITDMPEPEKTWRDLPAETVLMTINGYDVTAGELKEVSAAAMPAKSQIYNYAIQKSLMPSLVIKGHFKEHHEEIFKQLNDIRAEIESGKMTFEQAQEKYSTDPGKKNGYVYENIGRGQFVPEFDKMMFSIPLNKISDPFLSMYGGHILIVESEKLDAKGERETGNVRHILIGFDKYMDSTEAGAFQNLQQELMKNVKIEVKDSFLKSLLPKLGEVNVPPTPEGTEAPAEGETPAEPGAQEKPAPEEPAKEGGE